MIKRLQKYQKIIDAQPTQEKNLSEFYDQLGELGWKYICDEKGNRLICPDCAKKAQSPFITILRKKDFEGKVMTINEQKETIDFINKAERGRRIISEMSDVKAFEISEVEAIASFAAYRISSTDVGFNEKIQAVRMAIEAAYKFGQMHPAENIISSIESEKKSHE